MENLDVDDIALIAQKALVGRTVTVRKRSKTSGRVESHLVHAASTLFLQSTIIRKSNPNQYLKFVRNHFKRAGVKENDVLKQARHQVEALRRIRRMKVRHVRPCLEERVAQPTQSSFIVPGSLLRVGKWSYPLPFRWTFPRPFASIENHFVLDDLDKWDNSPNRDFFLRVKNVQERPLPKCDRAWEIGCGDNGLVERIADEEKRAQERGRIAIRPIGPYYHPEMYMPHTIDMTCEIVNPRASTSEGSAPPEVIVSMETDWRDELCTLLDGNQFSFIRDTFVDSLGLTLEAMGEFRRAIDASRFRSRWDANLFALIESFLWPLGPEVKK